MENWEYRGTEERVVLRIKEEESRISVDWENRGAGSQDNGAGREVEQNIESKPCQVKVAARGYNKRRIKEAGNQESRETGD